MIKTVPLSKSCELNLVSYSGGAKYLTLDYIEYSPAHGYSDMETSLDISRGSAQEIISILTEYLNQRSNIMVLTEQQKAEFSVVSQPLIDWLESLPNPHMTAIVNGNGAELMEGIYLTTQTPA